MRAALLALGLLAGAAPTAPPAPDVGRIPPEVEAIARAVAARPLGERMEAVSRPFLGLPYRVDAAGEGVPPDEDPPARYDAFDCVTFVEEVLALALSGDPVAAPAVRRSLRYAPGGPPDYARRNHFMMAQWLPNNVAAGWLRDITAELGETHLLVKRVGPADWASWRRRRLFHLPDALLPTGTFAMQVLSLGAAAEAVERIPDGALVVTVRRSRPGVPIVVTHVGFKIPSPPDVPLMRHATRMGDVPRVRDERLRWYVEHLRWYRRWPVEGIAVYLPIEPGPRLSRLAAAGSDDASAKVAR